MIAALPSSQPRTGNRPATLARTQPGTARGMGSKRGLGTARKMGTELGAKPETQLEAVLETGLLVGGWLPDMDLNHDKQIQSLLCYRYTIGQAGNAENVKISD